MGQSLIHFSSTFVCVARGPFIQSMINFRWRERQAQADKVDPKKFPQMHWRAKVKWRKNTRDGPPKERLVSLLSAVAVFRAGVSGGEADPKALWPELIVNGQWGKATEPSERNGKWKCANQKPLEVWLSQGMGQGLPIFWCRRSTKAPWRTLDQLVDTGYRTVIGVASVNGLAFGNMVITDEAIKSSLSGFEEAANLLKPAMDMVRENQMPSHNEKEGGKLADRLSVFKARVGQESTSGLRGRCGDRP